MKQNKNLLGEIAYQMSFISFLEGVKVSNPNITNEEFETLSKKFQEIWFKVQILAVNKVNDETIYETSDEILKLYFG